MPASMLDKVLREVAARADGGDDLARPGARRLTWPRGSTSSRRGVILASSAASGLQPDGLLAFYRKTTTGRLNHECPTGR